MEAKILREEKFFMDAIGIVFEWDWHGMGYRDLEWRSCPFAYCTYGLD